MSERNPPPAVPVPPIAAVTRGPVSPPAAPAPEPTPETKTPKAVEPDAATTPAHVAPPPAPSAPPEPQQDAFTAGLQTMLAAYGTTVTKNFTAARNKKMQAAYVGVLKVMNECQLEPDMAVYVITLLHQQIVHQACSKAGIE